MNKVTRQALQKVASILDEAGWLPATGEANGTPTNLSDETLVAMRGAYDRLLRPDYFEILQNTLEKRLSIVDAGRLMGLDPDASRRLFSEALNHLSQFVAACQER